MKWKWGLLLVMCSQLMVAQSGRKDTIAPDSSKLEKIHKMPMDTAQYKMPVSPVPPQKADPVNPIGNMKKKILRKRVRGREAILGIKKAVYVL